MPLVHRSEASRWPASRAESAPPNAGIRDSGSVVTAITRPVALSPSQAGACRSAGPVWGVLRVHNRAQCADKRRVISRPLRSTRVPFGPPLAAVAIALLALAAAGPARASTWTVTLAPKSGTGKDTYIRQGFSTQTNGSSTTLLVQGGSGATNTSTLVEFPLPSLAGL